MVCTSFYLELYMRFYTAPGEKGLGNAVAYDDDSTNYSKLLASINAMSSIRSPEIPKPS